MLAGGPGMSQTRPSTGALIEGHPRFDSILLSGELQEWYPVQRWVHQNQEIAVRPGHPPTRQ